MERVGHGRHDDDVHHRSERRTVYLTYLDIDKYIYIYPDNINIK